MDAFEKLFQRYIKKKEDLKNQSPSAVHLKDVRKSLEVFAGIFSEARTPLQLQPSSGYTGFSGNQLFLPSKITVSKDYQVNYKLYLNLILISGAANAIGLRMEPQAIKNEVISRILLLKEISRINNFLDSEFPNYNELQNELYTDLNSHIADKASFTAPFEFKKNKSAVVALWLQNYLRRDSETSSEMFSEVLTQIKENESLTELYTVSLPSFPIPKVSLKKVPSSPMSTEKSGEKPKTELEKPQSSTPEQVDFENEKTNPVTHSFEKMHTAEEYSGGRRIDSGKDELEEHQEALKELDLNKVTRGGESAQSVFKSDLLSFVLENDDIDSSSNKNCFLYPEWSVKKNGYLSGYCQLFESSSATSNQESNFKNEIEKKNRHQLSDWKKKIQNLVSTPNWIKKQKEGTEIDYDSYVYDFAILQKKKNVDGHWYAIKRKRHQDTAVFILMDQSLSVDSWVNNMRILDVITESVGLIGILFENYIDNVFVAGTWSETRNNCHFQYYKKPDQDWNSYFSTARSIEPQGYTRLGPAIRHAIKVLSTTKVEKKLLILLTDGKPTDLDGYEGLHGITDIKQACNEAESQNILPFALAIDKEAKFYFPKMFNHYKLLHTPKKLSEEIYNIMLKLLI